MFGLPVKILNLGDAEEKTILGGPIKVIFTSKAVGAKNLLFVVAYFKPSEGLVTHNHPESEEVYYVVEGKGTVYLQEESKEIQIRPKTSIYIPHGTMHKVTNTRGERLVVCFFLAHGKEESVEV